MKPSFRKTTEGEKKKFTSFMLLLSSQYPETSQQPHTQCWTIFYLFIFFVMSSSQAWYPFYWTHSLNWLNVFENKVHLIYYWGIIIGARHVLEVRKWSVLLLPIKARHAQSKEMEGKKKKKKKTERFFPPPGSFFLPRSRERLFDYENENEFETSCMRNDLTSISSGWGKKSMQMTTT